MSLEETNPRAIPPGRLWWLAWGFGVWGVALVALYALHAIGCVFGWSAGPLRVALWLVLLASVIVLVWLWRVARAAPDPAQGAHGVFLQEVIVGTVVGAFAAVVLTLAPPLLLATCR